MPVTIIDRDEAVVGYYPSKLISALKLDVEMEPAGNEEWLADKYDRVLGAAVRAVRQLSPAHLEQTVPWRPETVRELLLHILSFPELAWQSHRSGAMTTEDMAASRERLKDVATAEAIAEYGEGVREDLKGFLRSGDSDAFERVVPAYYGGEVTVVELLNIILRHSTHHLKQVYWLMENQLGVAPSEPASEEDLEGIATPVELV